MQGHVVCVLARNLNLYCNGLAKFRPLQKEHEISRPGNVIIFNNYRYIVESNEGRMLVMWRIKFKAGNLYASFLHSLMSLLYKLIYIIVEQLILKVYAVF